MAVLKGLTISVAGTLKYDAAQIKKWVEANGGTYTPTIRKGLTHLVASKHAWRSASDAVQTAVDLQAWVVSWDWLEDSLQDHRKKAEKPYSWEFLEQQRKKSREIEKLGARADRKKFEDGCVEARRATGSGMSKSKSKPRTSTRKNRESLTSYLLNDDPVKDVPFVSAVETLKRKKAEREAAKAAKATKSTPRASKPSSSSSSSSSKKAPSPTSPSPSAPSTPSLPLTTNALTPPNQRAKRPSLKDLYHYYLDATGFEYKILLTRCDLHRNTMQRYQLSILESHTKPNVYCTFIQYYPAAAPNTPDVNASGSANNEPGTSNSNRGGGGSATAGELGVMQAVLDFNASYPSASSRSSSSSSSVPPPSPSPETSPYTGPLEHHPEALRLRALTQDPQTPTAASPSSSANPQLASPSPLSNTSPETLPYKALLTPLSSAFTTAYASFRHAFRDLTLLSWEQRFDTTKSLYKARAEVYGVEPFVYIRPAVGMPVGCVLQIVVDDGGSGGNGVLCEGEGGQTQTQTREVKYAFLPALHAPLGNGVIGSAVAADRREAERREMEKEKEKREEEARRLEEAGEAGPAAHFTKPPGGPGNPAKRRRPRYDRPLFNGLLGPPGPPARERETTERERDGSGTVKRQSKAWPYETGLL